MYKTQPIVKIVGTTNYPFIDAGFLPSIVDFVDQVPLWAHSFIVVILPQQKNTHTHTPAHTRTCSVNIKDNTFRRSSPPTYPARKQKLYDFIKGLLILTLISEGDLR